MLSDRIPPVIFCAKCKKPVTETTTYFNQETDLWTFVVQCHGHLDSCTLDGKVFRSGWSIIEGVAFKNIDQPIGTSMASVTNVTVVRKPDTTNAVEVVDGEVIELPDESEPLLNTEAANDHIETVYDTVFEATDYIGPTPKTTTTSPDWNSMAPYMHYGI